MKRHRVCLQLRFEAPKDVKLEMLSRRAALSGNTSLQLPSFLVVVVVVVVVIIIIIISFC